MDDVLLAIRTTGVAVKTLGIISGTESSGH